MCGIGGIIFSKDREEMLKKQVQKIEHAQWHRGPDEQNIWVSGHVALCHQRLSIIDLQHGHQPMQDPTGRYILNYNGELYNYKALRQELSKSYHFAAHSDTEVVLAAYMVWGKKCLERFIGMFAFLIWDTETQTAFAARDVLGVKPFVYAHESNTFLFASEVKALIPVLPTAPKVDVYALAETILCPPLSGSVNTPFEEIRILPPGCYLEISKEELQITEYHNWNIIPNGISESTSVERFKEEFSKSVAYALQADVDVGCFLSGGLDSSYIAAQAQEISNARLKTFGILFSNHNHIEFSEKTIVGSNDKPFTDFMASAYQLEHHWAMASQSNILDSLEELSQTNDRICAWEQEVAQDFLSAKAAQQVKTILVGDAADETNYGYFFLLNPKVSGSPLGIAQLFGAEERGRLLNPALHKQHGFMEYLQSKYTHIAQKAGFNFGKNPEEDLLATSALVYKLWLGRLLHNGDIHTMRHGLEARVPFANQNVLEIAQQIPPHLGFKNTVEKHIVRSAAHGTLHDSIRLRKKSALPRDPRLGTEFQKILQALLKEENPFIDIFLNRKELFRLAKQNAPVSENQRMILFNIITLIYWSKHYVK